MPLQTGLQKSVIYEAIALSLVHITCEVIKRNEQSDLPKDNDTLIIINREGKIIFSTRINWMKDAQPTITAQNKEGERYIDFQRGIEKTIIYKNK